MTNRQLKTVLVHTVLLGSALASPWTGRSQKVQSGASIQAALNSAQPGDEFHVAAGTYAEQLTISTSGIKIVGHGAILVPPKSFGSNTCSGLAGNDTESGICITGAEVELAPFVAEHRKLVSVKTPVEHVSVTGFEIRGFAGPNIAVVGGKSVQVKENKLVDGDTYGTISVGSIDTHIAGNTVVSEETLRFIGICMDNISGAEISHNSISGYIIGLCIQTNGAKIFGNKVTNGCAGAFVDPGIKGARLVKNQIGPLNPACNASEGYPTSGIIIDGAMNTTLLENKIFGYRAGGNGSGIVVVDEVINVTPPAIASGNVVKKNALTNNDIDIFVNTTGSGNVVVHNDCSTPKELCMKS